MPASKANVPTNAANKAKLAIGSKLVGELAGFPVLELENPLPQTTNLESMRSAVGGMVAVQAGIPKSVFAGNVKFAQESIYGVSAGGGGGAASDQPYAVYRAGSEAGPRSPFETVLSRKDVDDLKIKIRSAFEYAKSLSERGLHDEGIALANVAECLQRLIPEYTQDGPSACGLTQVKHPVEQITLSATSPTTAVFSSGSMTPQYLAGQMGMEFEIVFSGQNVPGFNKQSVRCRLVSVDVANGP